MKNQRNNGAYADGEQVAKAEINFDIGVQGQIKIDSAGAWLVDT